MLTTKINNKWLVKILVFIFFLDALGVWGLIDANIVYPSRGQKSARWSEREYLAAAEESGNLLLASVDDPVAELATLDESEDVIKKLSGGSESGLVARQATTKIKRLDWLRALSVIGQLDPTFTHFENPQERLDELTAAQASQNPPKPLAAFDIPMQWVFVALGFGGGGWLLFLLLHAARKKYQYDPETLTLTLPTGQTITPAEISELDKRKWDKFLVTLRLKEGAGVRLDLLRYTPLEEWILEMETHTDGYEPEAAPKSEDDPASDESPSSGQAAAPPASTAGAADPQGAESSEG